MKKFAILTILFMGPWLCLAGGGPSDSTNAVESLLSKLHYQKGVIDIKNGLAKVTLPSDFRYLSPDDADIVLHQIWGNPPGPKTLGMIVPSEQSILDSEGYAIVITYMDDGYVKDSDAEKIDYTQLMKDMQASTREANKEREKQGYPSVELVGWAKPPSYDKSTHKMYWAKEIRFAGAPVNTLNYNIRVLGRSGVLVLNIVAPMMIFSEVDSQLPSLVGMADFTPGKRYSDFNQSTDKVAAYGLAALVAGGIAAKAGLFKLLWVGILAFKKFIILGCVALASFVKRLFGRKSAPDSSLPPSPPTG